MSDGAGGMDEAKEGDRVVSGAAPPAFQAAVQALRGSRLRPQIEIPAFQAKKPIHCENSAAYIRPSHGSSEMLDR